MIKNLLWQRTGGYWLFWITFVYFWIAMYSVFVENITSIEYIQAIWLGIASIPIWFKPLAKWLNMKTIWEIK